MLKRWLIVMSQRQVPSSLFPKIFLLRTIFSSQLKHDFMIMTMTLIPSTWLVLQNICKQVNVAWFHFRLIYIKVCTAHHLQSIFVTNRPRPKIFSILTEHISNMKPLLPIVHPPRCSNDHSPPRLLVAPASVPWLDRWLLLVSLSTLALGCLKAFMNLFTVNL